ncbi:MAG TPA: VOC family protein [Thermoanaerobaculia bacterium]|nr:VOC family protein [Thermoanaerobaculia bacterium]
MTVRAIPEGYHTVTPYVTVPDVDAMLDWVQRALGAKVHEVVHDAEGGARHADVIVGDSHIMMGRGSEQWPARPGSFYLYVEECDEWYRRAMAAGATSLREPTTEFYGDRSAGLTDPFGNQWWMATHVEDVSPEEMDRRAKEAWKV